MRREGKTGRTVSVADVVEEVDVFRREEEGSGDGMDGSCRWCSFSTVASTEECRREAYHLPNARSRSRRTDRGNQSRFGTPQTATELATRSRSSTLKAPEWERRERGKGTSENGEEERQICSGEEKVAVSSIKQCGPRPWNPHSSGRGYTTVERASQPRQSQRKSGLSSSTATQQEGGKGHLSAVVADPVEHVRLCNMLRMKLHPGSGRTPEPAGTRRQGVGGEAGEK